MLSQEKKESPDGEVDRPVSCMATHVYKNNPGDPLHLKHVVPKKDFGCDGKGYVCGMGGEVSKTEILASWACREQLFIEKSNNQGLQTHLNTLEARFNVFEEGTQDTAQPSSVAPKQNLVTRRVLRNLKKTAVAIGRVNFSINGENYEVLIERNKEQ